MGYLVSLQWKPSTHFRGLVTFRATVVTDYRTFWTGISSVGLHVRQEEGAEGHHILQEEQGEQESVQEEDNGGIQGKGSVEYVSGIQRINNVPLRNSAEKNKIQE